MKKQLMLSKQGVFFRIMSISLQVIVTIPLFLLLSFFMAGIIANIADIDDSVLVFKILFILFNIIWLVRNSIVKIYSDKIVTRDCIGAKKIIETENITSLKIITYKELRKMIFESSGTNPLITNTFALFIPMGNFVTFKNKFGRDVVIGVWNCKKLYELLNENASAVIESVDEEKDLHIPNKNNSYKSYKPAVRLFVKMPLKYHLITYLKLCSETIIIPLFFAGYVGWLLQIKGINLLALLPFAIALSLFII